MSDVTLIKIPPTLAIAIAVMNGVYGVGAERVAKLKKEGHDPVKVQAIVNELVGVWY